MMCLKFNEKTGRPCGQCRACRLNQQSEKALRIMNEAQDHEKGVFVTLTYSPENLPENGSLVRKDIQDCLKRMRRRVEPDELRIVGCGEYGDLGLRPHYHLIVFGVDMQDRRLFRNLRYVRSHDVYYCDCPFWKFGFTSVGKVNDARMAYVAKYCVKKITGKAAKEHYGDRLPEFFISPRRPGLGANYCDKHSERIKRDLFLSVKGKKRPLPRYYVDRLGKDDERWKYDRSFKVRESQDETYEVKLREKLEEMASRNGWTQAMKDYQEQRTRNIAMRDYMKGNKTKNV